MSNEELKLRPEEGEIEKLIRKCPVCRSENIEQDYRMGSWRSGSMSNYRDGSHCTNCGIKFSFNKGDKEDAKGL